MSPPAYNKLIDQIRLARSDGVGAKTFRTLMDRFGAATEAIARLPEVSGKRLSIIEPAAAEKEQAAAVAAGLRYVGLFDAAYPEPLRAIDDAPPLLPVKGAVDVLATPVIAVVGARNATVNGRKFAKQLAADLAQAGFTVISGMARGIDGAAHEGALAQGSTVAVLAGGTDVIYPPEHQSLYERLPAP